MSVSVVAGPCNQPKIENLDYPRRIPGVDEKALSRTLNIFSGNIVHHDLVRQWILRDGPFSYKFEWLSDRHSNESMATWASAVFKNTFGVHLNEFDIVSGSPAVCPGL
jgi:hypothetical protein